MRLARHAIALLVLALSTVASAQASPLPMTDDGGRLFRHGADLAGEATRFLGMGNVTGTVGPWCADFVSFVLRREGRRPLQNRMAAAGLSYGPPTANPKRGDIVVMNTRHGRAHHVGFFLGWTKGGVQIVSGNWSHRVAVSVISRRSVTAFIRT